MSCEPGDDVGDLLAARARVRECKSANRVRSIEMAGDDDAAQILIVDEREIGRVDDGVRS